MSYILQALKRAEEQRGASPRAVPSPRALPPPPPRARWPWIAGSVAGVVVAGSLAFWALTPSPSPAPTPTAAASDPPPPVAVNPATPRVEPPPRIEPSPRVERPPRRQPPARVESSPRVEPPPRIEPPARVERPARVEAPAPVERAPGAESPLRVETSRGEPDSRAERPRASAPSVARAPGGRSPSAGERGAPGRAVEAPSVTPRRDTAAAPPAAVDPPRVAAPGPGASPRVGAPPAAVPAAPSGQIKALTARLSLQVLGWAPEPKDRFVFVNGRKYGEGQTIDDKLLVERITEDGVVLSFQGERVTLKNP